jgi:peptide/nickel transport system substrate-binding protein
LPYDGGVVRPLLCTAVLCLTASACRGAESDSAAAAARSRAGALTIAFAAPRSSQIDERVMSTIVGLLSDERLVGLTKDGRPEPRLAERWEVSPDGLTWRVHLRPGLVFQNGERITSAAVRTAILAQTDPSGTQIPPGLLDLQAVETPTPDEIVLRLAKPNALLLESLLLTPVYGTKDSGAGPFQLTSQTAGRATLRRFDRYYRGRSQVDVITVGEYPSQREAWSAMLRGDVDMLYDVGPDAFEFVNESPSAHVATFLRPFVTGLVFNATHPVLGRRDVRRALNLAVDRPGVIESAAGGRAMAATDHIWPNHWARDASAPALAFDAAAARTTLDAAGLRPKAGPSPRFTFTCLVQADARAERLALLIQRQLLGIDVDMRLEALGLREFQQRLDSGRYDAFLSELATGYGLGLTYMWWHPGPRSAIIDTGYTGAVPALDRLRTARTDDDVRKAVHALQRTMADDPPAVFLYWRHVSRAVNRRFVLPAGDDQDILRTVDRWRLAGTEPGGPIAAAAWTRPR